MTEVAEALEHGLVCLVRFGCLTGRPLFILEVHSDGSKLLTAHDAGTSGHARTACPAAAVLGLCLAVPPGCSPRDPNMHSRPSAKVTLHSYCAGNGGGGGAPPSLIRKQLGADNVGLYSGK